MTGRGNRCVLQLLLSCLLLCAPYEPKLHMVAAARVAVGTFQLLLNNAGISSMHAAVTRFDTVILLDRTNIGPSMIKLPNGRCRDNPKDLTLKHDCTAHSVMFDPASNTVRPLFIQTDTWCSSGSFLPDGTMLQTGGDFDGLFKLRRLVPCPAGGTCDWVEDPTVQLKDPRWYATNVLLPDGRVIIVGGRNVFTYEFLPKAAGEGTFSLPFLSQTNDFENDNYYPYVYLLPDGNLYVFANRDSILLNYKTNTVLKKFPTIPGEPRNYPSAGSAVMLPLDFANGFTKVEVVVCGGAQLGAFRQPAKQFPCSQTCGRMEITAAAPAWLMETMPLRRCMGDMIQLPSGDAVIINGAQNGSQGFGMASNPAFNPVIYRPKFPVGKRFLIQPAGTIPRMYHCTANLLTDGRVLLAGSNTHNFYTFTGAFPTELRVEAWSPPYLDRGWNARRPGIAGVPKVLKFGQVFTVTLTILTAPSTVEMNLLSAPFSTHSYSQGQRTLRLKVTTPVPAGVNTYKVDVTAPPNANLAPPAYYRLFPVNFGIPGKGQWVQITR